AERLAGWWLLAKGYRILARDLRTPVGEIDLIVRRGRILAAIEVKARGDWESASAAVLGRQRRRVTRALEQFLAARPDLIALDARFDVMLVVPWHLPRHLRDAWRIG
ncbi:MAG: YraN family protein, partial [Stellaceae bacterium]